MSLPALVSEVGNEAIYDEFVALRGFDFVRKIKLWADEERNDPLSFAGLTIAFTIFGFTTLVDSAGLALNVGTSDVVLSLTPQQTEQAPEDQARFVLSASEGSEAVCPLHGLMSFTKP